MGDRTFHISVVVVVTPLWFFFFRIYRSAHLKRMSFAGKRANVRKHPPARLLVASLAQVLDPPAGSSLAPGRAEQRILGSRGQKPCRIPSPPSVRLSIFSTCETPRSLEKAGNSFPAGAGGACGDCLTHGRCPLFRL